MGRNVLVKSEGLSAELYANPLQGLYESIDRKRTSTVNRLILDNTTGFVRFVLRNAFGNWLNLKLKLYYVDVQKLVPKPDELVRERVIFYRGKKVLASADFVVLDDRWEVQFKDVKGGGGAC